MKRHAQIFLRAAPQGSPQGDTGRTTEDLAQLRENTLRLMRRGWRIPVLPRHAAAGSIDGGPQLAPVRAVGHPAGGNVDEASQAIGQLVDLVQLPDGSLGQVIELANEFTGAQFTSPEIRPQWTDPDGQQYGPIIAHVALTERPLSKGQTLLQPIARNESPHFPPTREGETNMNPTTAPTTRERDDAALEDVEVVETETPPREFPETDALPEEDTVLAEEEAGDDAAVAKPASGERFHAERSRLAERIRSSRKLPKGLRDRLAEVVETVQLSEEADDVPRVPVAEAVEMIEAAIPENLQFAEGPLATPAHPRGEGFFTGGASRLSDEDAQRIAAEQLAATGFGPQT